MISSVSSGNFGEEFFGVVVESQMELPIGAILIVIVIVSCIFAHLAVRISGFGLVLIFVDATEVRQVVGVSFPTHSIFTIAVTKVAKLYLILDVQFVYVGTLGMHDVAILGTQSCSPDRSQNGSHLQTLSPRQAS